MSPDRETGELSARQHCAPKRLTRRLLEGCGSTVDSKPWGVSMATGVAAHNWRDRHRLLIEAVLPEMAEGTVVSHQSAAVLYGTALWRTPLDRVFVTRNRRGGGRTRPYTKVHGSPLDSAVEIDGLLVTPPARTVIDLALSLPFEAAVVACDALTGSFGLTEDELAEELSLARCRHGIAQAKRVVAALDGRSQSAGESLSRLMLRRQGLPLPRTQGNVLTPDGRFVGRVDFYFEEFATLCEFDGALRYGRLLHATGNVADAMRREQVRETYLRALGFQVIRWTWNDLHTDGPARRLRAAMSRPRRADGRIEPAPSPAPRRIPVQKL
ncbi:hypothetical protein GFY24_26810 [Nocardia sp. SYP-A9097]|uniref:hypothetical protein n=1 Tax=Nocardia sp. SYP-A9097 TaxID=2663237 RepID=UPI00129B2214|nr:hypothetical protein [Nocardia sp. SYP-A9097]MRH91010.1 hypothetical protein [Nocardia sp. SYP-A9097]